MLHGPTDLPVGLQVNMCPYRLIYCMSMFASHAYVVIKRYFVRAEHECSSPRNPEFDKPLQLAGYPFYRATLQVHTALHETRMLIFSGH